LFISRDGRSLFILKELFSILEQYSELLKMKAICMSHSVPPDSSTADTAFLVGADLVEFDRRELPIYLTPETRWADAGCEPVAYGGPLDRLFGEPGEVFVDGGIGIHIAISADAATLPLVEDPLVVLSGLADGLILPVSENDQSVAALDDHGSTTTQATWHATDTATVYDFSTESHAILALPDPWIWDPAKTEWMVDHHT
jgi:hypothetical protein